MGRKPKATPTPEAQHQANANGSSSPPLESKEGNQISPSSLPSKKEASNSGLPSKKKLSKKASSSMDVVVRRSGRLRNVGSAMPNQKMIVEEIDLADSENEEEPLVQQWNSEPLVQQSNSEPLVQQLNSEPLVQQLSSEPLVQQLSSEPLIQQLNSEPSSNQHALEEKIDFIVRCIEEFKSQGKKRPFPFETQAMELNYRSLYIESQKKIDALTEENHQLAKKLEFASGKVEAYEKMKDVVGNLKDMVFVTNLGRATEAVMNLSTQAATGKFNLPETTAHDAAVPVDEARTTSPTTHKKYVRKKK